jgi:hypothetical protein
VCGSLLRGKGTRHAEGCQDEKRLVKDSVNDGRGEGQSSRAVVWGAVVQGGKLQGGLIRAGFQRVEVQQRGVLWCEELKGGVWKGRLLGAGPM